MTHPYPNVTLSIGGPRQMDVIFINEETGEPVDLLKVYEILSYYQAVCRYQKEQTDHLYKQMANAWPVKPVVVMED